MSGYTSGSRRGRAATQVGTALVLGVLVAMVALGVGAGDVTTSSASWLARPESGLTNGQVITIGVGASLSVAADFGVPQANAVQLAVNQANAAGGVEVAGTTYSLALVIADDGCSADQGAGAANTLMAAGAVAVVGYTCSGASNAAQPIHAAAGVAMISPSSTGPDVTEKGHNTTFRVISRDDAALYLLPTVLIDEAGLDKCAIVELDSFWGNWVPETLETSLETLGGTLTSRRHVASTAEFTATLTAIQLEAPEVIYYADDSPANAALLSRVAHNLGMTDVAIAWCTLSDDRALMQAYAGQAGEAAEGDYVGMFYRSAWDMPGFGPFDAAYRAASFSDHGDAATTSAAFAYDAANIIIDAIDRADSTDPAAIRDAIASTADHRGVVGLYKGFDAKGDVIPAWAWVERYQDGVWVSVQPKEVFLPATLGGQ